MASKIKIQHSSAPKYFSHTRREKVFKVTYRGVYLKGPNFWIQALNLLIWHSFFNVGLTHCFFLLRILNIFNTHERRGECFLKKLTVVYIQNGTGFKPLKLTLIFQCRINLLFFLLRILSVRLESAFCASHIHVLPFF